jgi:AAA+ ATPase superfamily predicted ATPase
MIIGRKPEIKALNAAMSSDKAEMIAVIGRRRVGKTFLIDEVLGPQIVFQQTGVRHAPADRQLRTFSNNLTLLAGKEIPPVKDWLDAFFQLRLALEPRLNPNKKCVVFFDELSWLATPEGEFLDYLAHFWNDWGHRQPIVLVLCGSVSSWIINRVINDKGGLHNRVTRYLHLKPFTLAETAAFLESRNVNFPPRQIIQLYMALGGIPLYLEDLQPSRSLSENLDRICFSNTGFLREEFNRLYPALFEDARLHTEVVRALAASPRGLTRTQIINAAALPNGGATSTVLEELEASDFIQSLPAFGNKKTGKIYRLIDEYSLFYLRFIEANKLTGAGTWLQLCQRQTYNVWAGYAFESICFKHVAELKSALGISGVYTAVYSYVKNTSNQGPGVQVDLLLERADRVINLCEMKFHRSTYSLSKSSLSELELRLQRFVEYTKTKYHVIPTIVAGGELKENDLSQTAGVRMVSALAFFG